MPRKRSHTLPPLGSSSAFAPANNAVRPVEAAGRESVGKKSMLRKSVFERMNDTRISFMAGLQVHDDDTDEISSGGSPNAELQKSIAKKSLLQKQQSETEYAETIKHRRASVIMSERVRQSPVAWLACIAVGLATGVADGAMIRLLMELFALKDKLLQWTTEHVSLGTAFFVMLAFCLPLTMIAAIAVM